MMTCMLAVCTYVVQGSLGGRSLITLTKFGPLLITYLLPVDIVKGLPLLYVRENL